MRTQHFRKWQTAFLLLFTASVILVLRLCMSATAQSLDSGFTPGASYHVYSLAVQADGRVLVGGSFRELGGQMRDCIGRFNADGVLDSAFNAGVNQGDMTFVSSLAVQADGKILVGGCFTTLCGLSRDGIGRLNADGTLDAGFNPEASRIDPYTPTVSSIAVQEDGKILVVGTFNTLCGQPRNHIGRLNADGTLDTTFNPGADNSVHSLAVQADGKILVGGYFTALGDVPRNHIGRLRADGAVDDSFDPGVAYSSWRPNYVHCIALQADGKSLVGGAFTMLGGQTRNYIGRLNADGTLDASFDPGASNPSGNSDVHSLAVQANGKILVGGSFTKLAGQERPQFGQLNADGTLDSSFDPESDPENGIVSTLAVQQDGKLLVGGFFSVLGGQARSCIARLNNTEPASQNLTYERDTITWLRSGPCPEVTYTTFEGTTNGLDWTALGKGVRVPGGWRLTGLDFATNATIRARGYSAGGGGGHSCWFVESLIRTPPTLAISWSGDVPVLSVRGTVGSRYSVDYVSSLSVGSGWRGLVTNMLTSNPLTLTDTSAVGMGQRFYRARLVP